MNDKEKIHIFILYRIMEVIFYRPLQIHQGTKERIKQNKSHLGLDHFLLFSENSWQQGGSVAVSSGSALNSVLSSIKCVPRNADTKSCNFFLLLLILLLLESQDLWVEKKIQAEGTFPLGPDANAAPGRSP